MKIAIFGKHLPKIHHHKIDGLFKKLKEVGADLSIYEPFLEDLIQANIPDLSGQKTFSDHSNLDKSTDFLFSLGGDGTFLNTITFVRDSHIPILGINTGRLGFLSVTGTYEIDETIDALVAGNYQIEKRRMISFHSEPKLFGNDNFALNEISLTKRDSSSMITIHTNLNGRYLNSYWADGLIISTATGSTAYNLSCGGPILMPGIGSLSLTPIAPHNLNVRPIVVDDDAVLKLEIESRSKQNLVTLDSRSALIDDNTTMTIQKANFEISLVTFSNHSFIHSLRNKLNWGLDSRNI